MNVLNLATNSIDGDTLHRLATCSKDRNVLIAVAQNPATRWETIAIIHRQSRDSEVRDATSNRLQQLWVVPAAEEIRAIIQSAPESLSIYVYLLFNPLTPPDVLAQAARFAPHTKIEVIQHPNVTLDILLEFLAEEDLFPHAYDLIYRRIEEIGVLGLLA